MQSIALFNNIKEINCTNANCYADFTEIDWRVLSIAVGFSQRIDGVIKGL